MWLAALPGLATRARPLALALFLYLLTISASATASEPLYGWYGIPFYALLAPVAAGELLARRGRVPTLFLFWVLYVFTSLEMLQQLMVISAGAPRYLLVLGLPILALELMRRPSLARARVWTAWAILGFACCVNVFLALELGFLYGQ